MEYLVAQVTSRFPDLEDIVKIFNTMLTNHQQETQHYEITRKT